MNIVEKQWKVIVQTALISGTMHSHIASKDFETLEIIDSSGREAVWHYNKALGDIKLIEKISG